MKAFLLAGGRGERLHPITRSIPKCLVPIAGEPLLAIWLRHLVEEGITDVLVNVSHHAEQVEQLLGRERWGLSVRLEREPQPRGNAGTVAAYRDFVTEDEDFFVLYSDNLTDAKLAPLLAAHQRHRGPMTIGLFRAPMPSASGIVELAADGTVVGFVEKPAHPVSDLANAGIYVARQSIFEHIPSGRPVVDFGLDVIPGLVGRISGHVLGGFLMDVGTVPALAHAERLWVVRGSRSLIS